MDKKSNLTIKGMVFAALFAALTAAVSPFKIPLGFTPVPITLQTLVVLLSGGLLGPRLGGLSQLIYLIVGALGLPVFAGGGSGLGSLLGPTGGYLISYPIAAFTVGLIIKRLGDINSKKVISIKIVYAMLVGTIIIYALGASWGKIVTGLAWVQILVGWVLPFIIGDLVKLIIAAIISTKFSLKKYLK